MGKAKEWMVRGPFSSGLYELVPAQDVLIASKDCLFVREVLDTSHPDHVASEDKQGAEDAADAYLKRNPFTLAGFDEAEAAFIESAYRAAFLAGVAYAERKGFERVAEFLRSDTMNAHGPETWYVKNEYHEGSDYADEIEKRFLKEKL